MRTLNSIPDPVLDDSPSHNQTKEVEELLAA